MWRAGASRLEPEPCRDRTNFLNWHLQELGDSAAFRFPLAPGANLLGQGSQEENLKLSWLASWSDEQRIRSVRTPTEDSVEEWLQAEWGRPNQMPFDGGLQPLEAINWEILSGPDRIGAHGKYVHESKKHHYR